MTVKGRQNNDAVRGRHSSSKRQIEECNKDCVSAGALTPTRDTKPPNNARDTRAAEPMAKPLPIAAVVFPAASSASVFTLTKSGNSAISASPP